MCNNFVCVPLVLFIDLEPSSPPASPSPYSPTQTQTHPLLLMVHTPWIPLLVNVPVCLFVFRSLIPLRRASQLRRDGGGRGGWGHPEFWVLSTASSSLLHRRLRARFPCHLQSLLPLLIVVVSDEKCSIRVLVEVETSVF